MAQTKTTRRENKPHRVLREVYRNFRQFREYVASSGNDVIEHGWFDDDGNKVMITISYSDLLGRLNELSERKRQAVFYNVIMDMKQRDVAEIMGITTVSVGQYVDTAMEQLAEKYFADHIDLTQIFKPNGRA